MSNPDRLLRQAREHAEFLLDSRGEAAARRWLVYCANRTTDGFWSRVLQAFEALVEELEERDNENDDDPAADYGDWRFHQDHDQ